MPCRWAGWPTGSSGCRSSAWSSIAFGAFVLASGFALNAFMLFWTRFATGITKANTIPVHGSLIADAYPIGVRARMSAVSQGGARAVGQTPVPSSSAAIAEAAGGPEGWRWVWYLLGIPVAFVAVGAFFMKEPPRGQFEKEYVLDEVVEEERSGPDLDGGGLRPPEEDRHHPHRPRGLLRPRVRPVQPGRPWRRYT